MRRGDEPSKFYFLEEGRGSGTSRENRFQGYDCRMRVRNKELLLSKRRRHSVLLPSETKWFLKEG